MKSNITAVVATGLIASLALVGCGKSGSSNNAEQAQQNEIQSMLDKNQPIPMVPFSEKRQVLIDVQNAQIKGVATTTFFYNQGVREPFFTCPSIGFPLPSTAQLTNPRQVIYTPHPQGGNDASVVDQMDPDGVYSGDSTGTYVECVAPGGLNYIKYWEGFVDTIGGPAHWDGKTEVLDGPPTVVTKGGK